MFLLKEGPFLRVTLLLYLLVLLFPLNIYLANGVLSDTQTTSQTIMDLKRISGMLQELSDNPDGSKRSVAAIDEMMRQISENAMQGDVDSFNVGFDNVQTTFGSLRHCWETYRTQLRKERMNEAATQHSMCQNLIMKLVVQTDKLGDIRGESALLRLNIALIFTMIVMVVMIYFVRTTIKKEIERHTIYDVQTKLFNRDYFEAEIKKACALAQRKKHPLTMITISIDNFKEGIGMLEEKKYAEVIAMFGGLLLSMTRVSDTASRYEEGVFTIITPETTLHNVETVAQRIHKRIIEHHFNLQHPITVTIAVALLHENEEAERLVARTLRSMREASKQGNIIVTSDVRS